MQWHFATEGVQILQAKENEFATPSATVPKKKYHATKKYSVATLRPRGPVSDPSGVSN